MRIWFLLSICLFSIITSGSMFAKSPVVGELAPSFRLTTFDGKEIALEDLRGQVVVLNFWATWCAPCREELPLLDGYYKLREKSGLRILAVTTEDSLPIYRLKPLQAVVAFPLARKFKGSYGTKGAVPTNYVIDRAGVLRYAAAGSFTLQKMNEVLTPLLQQTIASEPAVP
jgi:cytochrome c biogenesis protein CcmG, thiol:disulfide interchange protein DsbE